MAYKKLRVVDERLAQIAPGKRDPLRPFVLLAEASVSYKPGSGAQTVVLGRYETQAGAMRAKRRAEQYSR